MARIHFTTRDGTCISVEAFSGSVMKHAVSAGVPGIEGQCGGSMSCGTCHVQIPPEWANRLGPASVIEADLLEFEEGYSPLSRLSCQIEVTQDIDGLTLTVMGK